MWDLIGFIWDLIGVHTAKTEAERKLHLFGAFGLVLLILAILICVIVVDIAKS